MSSVKSLVWSTCAAGVFAIGTAGFAQGGLVNVEILEDVRIDIADALDVNVSQIPVTVQAPIGIAANVCNVGANVLAADINQTGTADCRAEQTSRAFNNLIARQLNLQ